MNYKKRLLLISIFICILFTTTTVYANDFDKLTTNETQLISQTTEITDSNMEQLTLQDYENPQQTQTVYFNASAIEDGNGTQNNPYKYYAPDRISAGTNAYFADGIYNISSTTILGGVTFTGQSENTVFTSNTVYNFNFIISENSNLILNNLTLQGIHISNRATLEANHIIFKDSMDFRCVPLKYCNNIYSWEYVGIIVCDTPVDKNTKVKLYDCYFENNSASSASVIAAYNTILDIKDCIFYKCSSDKFGGVIYGLNSNLNITNSLFYEDKSLYGGALYVKKSNLKINNSEFYYCTSESFAGAIASDTSKILINNCNFQQCQSINDAGGMIYSVNSTLNISKSGFDHGKALFGGAICNLKTNLTLTQSNFTNNLAKNYGGVIYNMYGVSNINNNIFFNSTAYDNGGTLSSYLAKHLNISNNTFELSTAATGQMIYFDGENGTLIENNNIYRNLYYLLCVYNAQLDGNGFTLPSNFLTFSVSNDGNYIQTSPIPNNNTDIYASFNITVNNHGMGVIQTPYSQSNSILFNLTKYVTGFSQDYISVYFFDNNVNAKYLGYIANLINTTYTNQPILSLNFNDNLVKTQYGNKYTIDPYSSVFIFNYTLESSENIPSYYDSRDYGYITPVGDQKDAGNCWAFSGLDTLEACLKKAINVTFDFSEENLKNLMAEYSLFGLNKPVNDGGNYRMIIAYLASWLGPINDDEDKYDDYSALSLIYNPLFHVQNVYMIPDRLNVNDNDLIKKAIMDYGAVSISSPWEGGSHAVTLIGWDDNYNNQDCFGNYTQGAWLFKNSWGIEWGDNGYGYLSYDVNITNYYTFILSNETGYNHIYQYDFAGLSTYLIFPGLESIYYMNVFKSESNDILSAVSTYFDKPANYTVSIYLNNTLVSTQNGYASSGYYTLPLENEVPLSVGDVFIVQIKKYGSLGQSIPFCSANYINKITFDKGISFYSTDGQNWNDSYIYNSVPRVACIKVFTRPAQLNEIEITVDKFSKVIVNQTFYVNVELPSYCEGIMTFIINGKYYYAPVVNGNALLNISLSEIGEYNLTAQYRSNLEISNRVSFNFTVVNVNESNIRIETLNITKYYGGLENYTAVIYDNNITQSNVWVQITVDDKLINLKTDENGMINYNLNYLSCGNHTVSCKYFDTSVDSFFNIKSTINANDIKLDYLDTFLFASFIDSNGNPIVNNSAIFKIDDDVYNITINNGYAIEKIDLNVSNYNIIVINPVTGEECSYNMEVVKFESSGNFSYSQIGRIVTLTVKINSKLATGNVQIMIGGDMWNGSVKDGEFVVNINNLNPGKYTADIAYWGDNNFKSFFISDAEINVNQNKLNMTVNDVYKYYGGSEKLVVNVYNDGVPLNGACVNININNKRFNITTNESGVATALILINSGSYNVFCEYAGVVVSSKFIVNSTIDVYNASYEYSKSIVSGCFYDSNHNPLNNRVVQFLINNVLYNVTTNDQGYVASNLTLNAGNHTVKAINLVTGEKKYYNLNVVKSTPSLSFDLLTFDDYYTLKIKLSPVTSSGNIIFTFEDKEYSAGVYNGSSSFTMYIGTNGSYNISVRHTGDSNLNPVSDSKVYEFEDKSYKIISKSFIANYGDDKYLEVELINSKGEPVKNTNVTYYITGNDGSSYTDDLITNSYGYAKVKFNLDPATYDVILSSVNFGYLRYNVIINKLIPVISTGKKTFKVKTKNKKYKLTLKVNGVPFKFKSVTLKVKGKTYRATTNSYGKAVFKLSKLKKKGKYKAKITFVGDKFYQSVSKSVKIKVKK